MGRDEHDASEMQSGDGGCTQCQIDWLDFICIRTEHRQRKQAERYTTNVYHPSTQRGHQR